MRKLRKFFKNPFSRRRGKAKKPKTDLKAGETSPITAQRAAVEDRMMMKQKAPTKAGAEYSIKRKNIPENTECTIQEMEASRDGRTGSGKDQVVMLDEFNKPSKFTNEVPSKPEAATENQSTIHDFCNLSEFREICDAEIHIDNDVFLVSRHSLSSFSSYFSDYFSKETGKEGRDIYELSGLSSEAFTVFLEFVYKREFNVNIDNLADVIKMADELSIPVIKGRCLEKAVQNLSSNRCPPNSWLSEFLGCHISKEFSHAYLIDGFYELDVSKLCRILLNDNLQTSSEKEVFKVAMAWIDYVMPERDHYLCRVMRCVRFPYMTSKELGECLEIVEMLRKCSKLLLKQCSNLRKKILLALWVVTARALKGDDPLNIPIMPARNSFAEKQQLEKKSTVSLRAYAVPEVCGDVEPEVCGDVEPEVCGDIEKEVCGDVEPEVCGDIEKEVCGDVEKEVCGDVEPEVCGDVEPEVCGDIEKEVCGDVEPEVCGDVGQKSNSKDQGLETPLAQNYGDILVIGGYLRYKKFFGNKQGKLVQSYDPMKNQWSSYKSLPEPRFHHAAAMLNGKLYLTGGSDSKRGNVPVPFNNASKDVFVFNFETKKWTKIASMNTPRISHTICSLHGMLYVIGGKDEKSRVLKSVECYNPKKNEWIYVESMMVPRHGASAAVLDGKIIVAGGLGLMDHQADVPVLGTVESYDPTSDSWKESTILRFPRCHGNLVNVNGNLYLCGGATYTLHGNTRVLTSVRSIDVYNEIRGIWEEKANLNIARHHTGCAVSGGRIYIIGGESTEANKILRSVECYDVTSDIWDNGIKKLPYPTKWLSCVTLQENH